MKDISRFVDHQLCPSIDGIVFPDGEIQPIVVNVDWGPPLYYRLELSAKTSIKELKGSHQLYWSECAIICNITDNKRQIEVIAGEADHGSDGFVATLSRGSNDLKWIAFFTCSNPFSSIAIDNNQILATSSLEVTWVFPINNPAAVIVKSG